MLTDASSSGQWNYALIQSSSRVARPSSLKLWWTFIIKWTDLSAPPNQGPIQYWKMYFDGSLNIDGAGAGMLFISPTKD
jgi:hypothetical protein